MCTKSKTHTFHVPVLPLSFRSRAGKARAYLAGTAIAACLALAAHAQTAPTITDIGSDPPTLGPDDVSQLVDSTGANSPDGLNYYFDNGHPAGPDLYHRVRGQWLHLDVAGDFDRRQQPAACRLLARLIFCGFTPSPRARNAELLASYTSQDGFTFTDLDWLQWTDLEVALPANTQFAYSFGRSPSGAGWENLGNVSGNPYAGGEVALIPPAGGGMTFGSSHDYDATFVVGLTAATSLIVNPPRLPPAAPLRAERR